MSDLKGKTALVTGSTQGIGLGIATELAKAGVRIAVHGLATRKEGEAIARTLEKAGAPETKFFEGDVTNVSEIEAMMAAVENWQPIDILVNNAGTQKTVSLAEATPEIWDTVIAINLSAAWHTMRLALPKMAKRGYGRVINIASVHGLVASVNKSPYVASKFGLVGMSKVAALEYASAGNAKSGGVTVNAICPGWTETTLIEPQIMERAALHGGDRDAGIADLLAEKQPSMRTTDVSELGALAVWLCAPIAHNVTGTAIPVDGGWTAQ